jgi:hypothetical protein
MHVFRHEMIPGDPRGCSPLNGSAAVIVGILLLWISSLLSPEIAFATTIYSYIDDHGTPVLTDNFENIPERYRARVKTTEQPPKDASDHSAAVRLQQKFAGWVNHSGAGLGRLTPKISGLTHYQSRVLSFGGIGAVICLLARFFVRSQVVRFLSLWCLIMLGLTVPALLFTSQDAALDLLSDESVKIQEKQQEHLRQAP